MIKNLIISSVNDNKDLLVIDTNNCRPHEVRVGILQNGKLSSVMVDSDEFMCQIRLASVDISKSLREEKTQRDERNEKMKKAWLENGVNALITPFVEVNIKKDKDGIHITKKKEKMTLKTFQKEFTDRDRIVPKCTCTGCLENATCEYAFDPRNQQGDCIKKNNNEDS